MAGDLGPARHVMRCLRGVNYFCRCGRSNCRRAPLTQSVDTGDDDVRTQAPDVAPEGGNSAVGRDEQRQDVEAIEALPRLEPGVGARGPFDQRKGIRAVPQMAIDPRTVGSERSAQTEQPVLAPRCAHPFRASHTHDAVAAQQPLFGIMAKGWRCFGCSGMKPSPSIQRLPHAMNGTGRCAGKGSWQRCGGPMDFSASRSCQSSSSSPSRHSTTTGAPSLVARARRERTRRHCPNPRRAALDARLRGRLLGTRQDGPFKRRGRAWAVKGVVPAR